MDYRDFVERVKEQIKDFLPEKFSDAEVSIQEVIKNNDCRLEGLCIKTRESNIIPTIYLNSYYDELKDGAKFEDILTAIAECYQEHYVTRNLDIEKLQNYDQVKDKVICKLINKEANQDYLEDKSYTGLEDLAVIYQILLEKRGDDIATVTVTSDLLERFGVSLEDLHEQALKNTEVLQPHRLRGLNEVIIDMMAGNIAKWEQISMDEARKKAAQRMPDEPEKMYVLTNDTNINGAATILNDTVRQEIAEKIGDFYVLPSSIHETLIVPKNAGLDAEQLGKIVKDVNRTQVAEPEILSDHVYEYDAKEHELFRVDKTRERMNAREHREEKGERHSLKDRLAEKKDKVIKADLGKEEPTAVKKRQATL